MPSQHVAEAEAQPVIEAERGAVEHLPEPDERLAGSVLSGIDVAVVLGLEGGVAGVEGLGENVGGEFGGEMDGETSAVGTAKVKLGEFVADDLGAAVDRLVAGELAVEMREPAEIDGFGFGARFEIAVGVDWHGFFLNTSKVETLS